MNKLSLAQTRRLRLRSQCLHLNGAQAPGSATQLLSHLCGVQAQDPAAAVLAVGVRSSGLIAADVERARVHERSIVRTWCMRGTLHLLATEDLGWLLPLLGPKFVRNSGRRYAELGLHDNVCANAIRALRSILGDQGPMTRDDLIDQLTEWGIPTEGQAAYHLIRRAGLEGVICFGPEREGEPTYVLLADWAPTGAAVVEDAALAELARRYVAAYGPAGPEDLAAWSGLSMSEARTGLEMILADLLEVEIGGSSMWILKSQSAWLDETRADRVVVRLLPGFDPYLIGYRSRELAVPQRYAKRIHPGGGVLRPALLVDGCAVGTWTRKQSRSGLVVSVEPFEVLGAEVVRALEEQVQEMGRFLKAPVSMSVRTQQM